MSATGKKRIVLDPETPGLEDETRARRRALLELTQLPIEEPSQVASRRGTSSPAIEELTRCDARACAVSNADRTESVVS